MRILLLVRGYGSDFGFRAAIWAQIDADKPYAAVIAAISGAMPMMFKTRLRL